MNPRDAMDHEDLGTIIAFKKGHFMTSWRRDRIVFVDPQDQHYQYWWPALVQRPLHICEKERSIILPCVCVCCRSYHMKNLGISEGPWMIRSLI